MVGSFDEGRSLRGGSDGSVCTRQAGRRTSEGQSLRAWVNASGNTGPAPAWRSSDAITVSVQRESTMSSTRYAGPRARRPRPRTRPTRWRTAARGCPSRLAVRVSRVCETTGRNGSSEPRREPRRERRDQLRVTQRRDARDPRRRAGRAPCRASARPTRRPSSSEYAPATFCSSIARPQPPSPATPSTRPGSACSLAGMREPSGHCLRGSMREPLVAQVAERVARQRVVDGVREQPVAETARAATARRGLRIVELAPQELHEAARSRRGTRASAPARRAAAAVTASTRVLRVLPRRAACAATCCRSRSTTPSTSSTFSMFSSRPRRRLTSRSISPSLTQLVRASASSVDHLLGVLARRERGADEVVLDLAVFSARRARSRTPGRARARPVRPAGSTRSPSRAPGSGRRTRGRACRSPCRAPRSRPRTSARCACELSLDLEPVSSRIVAGVRAGVDAAGARSHSATRRASSTVSVYTMPVPGSVGIVCASHASRSACDRQVQRRRARGSRGRAARAARAGRRRADRRCRRRRGRSRSRWCTAPARRRAGGRAPGRCGGSRAGSRDPSR